MRFDLFDSVRAAAGQPCTLDAYLQLAGDPRLARLAAEIGACEDKEQRQRLKKQLPVICWQASFGGKRRTNANAVPSGLYMADYDDVADVQGLMEAALRMRQEQRIVYIGRSISGKGVRIVAECRPEFSSIAECQRALSAALGQRCDEACKDWARASYAVPAAYEFYIDQSLFEREPTAVYGTESRDDGATESRNHGAAESRNHGAAESRDDGVSESRSDEGGQTTFRGAVLADIATAWLEQNGGMPQEGERNARLFKLATRMRYITDFDPATIAACIPHCGLPDDEVAALCRSACLTQRAVEMPWDLKSVLERLAVGDEGLAVSDEGLAEKTLPLPPLPPVFKQFADAAPEDFKPATVLCLLPILGTLGSRLRGCYLNGKMETPSFQVTLEAPQASGKSFIEKMSDRCLRELKKKDDEGHALERIYQEEDRQARLGTTKKERAERKQMLEERTVPIIRKMPATASITKLLMRMENAQGLHLFALAVEIDTVHKAFKRGFSNLSDLLRCAFDNSEYGQDYATDTSFSGNLPVFYNTLYSGTPKAIRRFYPDCEDGTMSRTLFVTLPDQFGKPMPVWRDMTDAEEALVDEALARLYAVSLVGDEVQPEHEQEMPFLNDRLEAWMEAQRRQSVESGDRVRNTFYRRCAEAAFRAGMVSWSLYGEKQTPKVKSDVCKFAVWVAEMMLQQFMLRVEPEDEQGKGSFLARAVYNALPPQFTREQLEQHLRLFGVRTDVYHVVSAWRKHGRILSENKYGQPALTRYTKTEF